MYLKNISLTNFKNYDQTDLEFSSKINCLVGNNGVGKTNVLDAIHYLSLTKSFFNNIDSISIKHGEEYFIIEGNFKWNGNEDHIICAFQRQKQKSFKKNSKEYQKLSEHIGRFPVVMISPADSALISEGSEERRRFMNKIISQYNSVYLDAILKYGKALQQRNKLLKDFRSGGNFDQDMIEIWNQQLVKYGTYIYNERKSLTEELVPLFNEYYKLISSGNEEVKLSYRSQLDEGDFASILIKNIDKDRLLEYTTAGIHKDDLLLEMNGHPVKSLGSQGQQKSYLVALKLSKFDYIKRKSGIIPVLLLDDIFDKFDATRVEQIIKLVSSEMFGQIFITDTHQERLHKILNTQGNHYRLFQIEGNRAMEITGN